MSFVKRSVVLHLDVLFFLTLSMRHLNQRFSQSSVSKRYDVALSSSVRLRVFVTVSLFSGRAISIVTTVFAILKTSSTEYGHPDKGNRDIRSIAKNLVFFR